MSDAVSALGPVLPDGYRLLRYDRIGSTNDAAKDLARSGGAEGTVVWAGEQTAGRGRRGRSWASPPGNLHVSLVLRPAGGAAHAAQLGFVAAVALVDAVAALTGPALRLECKWPNDVLANGCKLAGILLESETSAAGAVDFVVIGVGANLAFRPGAVEYPATSLTEEGFPEISPGTLLEAFVGRFDTWARRWRADGFAPVRAAWLARAFGVGEAIRVRLERSTLLGRFIDLDEDGALLLDAATDQGGGRRRIAAGEVFPAPG
jgi:BirA family biotin operon repressor/biotin-[acetyl-CoA-carboxylase] ligase